MLYSSCTLKQDESTISDYHICTLCSGACSGACSPAWTSLPYSFQGEASDIGSLHVAVILHSIVVHSIVVLMMQHFTNFEMLLLPIAVALDLKNKKSATFEPCLYQKVLPELKNVAKTESNVAIEGHFVTFSVVEGHPAASQGRI